MFKGSVSFAAQIKDQRVTFSRLDFNPDKPGVDKVEIEGLGGHIHSTVHLRPLNHTRPESVLQRMSTLQPSTALLSRRTSLSRMPTLKAVSSPHCTLHPSPATSARCSFGCFHKGPIRCTSCRGCYPHSRRPTQDELEREKAPGEHNYGLFQSARQSTGPVEEFMHLYHILLILYNDNQSKVDEFIRDEDPSVPQTQARPGK